MCDPKVLGIDDAFTNPLQHLNKDAVASILNDYAKVADISEIPYYLPPGLDDAAKKKLEDENTIMHSKLNLRQPLKTLFNALGKAFDNDALSNDECKYFWRSEFNNNNSIRHKPIYDINKRLNLALALEGNEEALKATIKLLQRNELIIQPKELSDKVLNILYSHLKNNVLDERKQNDDNDKINLWTPILHDIATGKPHKKSQHTIQELVQVCSFEKFKASCEKQLKNYKIGKKDVTKNNALFNITEKDEYEDDDENVITITRSHIEKYTKYAEEVKNTTISPEQQDNLVTSMIKALELGEAVFTTLEDKAPYNYNNPDKIFDSLDTMPVEIFAQLMKILDTLLKEEESKKRQMGGK